MPDTRTIALAAIKDALKNIQTEDDKKIFKKVVGNEPGPGAPIVNPENNGFYSLDNLATKELLQQHVIGAVPVGNREEMFQNIISLVHRLAPNFSVYVGRTFYRKNEEHLGPYQRWREHKNKKGMHFGKVLFSVPRNDIERSETVANSLVKVWQKVGALCCNNTVMLSNGKLSNDNLQVIYICIKPKRLRS